MLVNKSQPYAEFKLSGLRNAITAVVCIALFSLLTITLTSTNWAIQPATFVLTSTLVTIAKHFFFDYLLAFELASILLLVALVGAIVIARREFVPNQKVGSSDLDESLSLLEKPREQLVGTK